MACPADAGDVDIDADADADGDADGDAERDAENDTGADMVGGVAVGGVGITGAVDGAAFADVEDVGWEDSVDEPATVAGLATKEVALFETIIVAGEVVGARSAAASVGCVPAELSWCEDESEFAVAEAGACVVDSLASTERRVSAAGLVMSITTGGAEVVQVEICDEKPFEPIEKSRYRRRKNQ